jgi:hypothetical protein
MVYGNAFNAVPMSTFNSAGLSGTYAALNGTGLPHDCRQVEIYNGSTVAVIIALDPSVTAGHSIVPAGGWKILDLQTNNDPNASQPGIWHMKKGQILWGKGSAGSGNIYVMGYF